MFLFTAFLIFFPFFSSFFYCVSFWKADPKGPGWISTFYPLSLISTLVSHVNDLFLCDNLTCDAIWVRAQFHFPYLFCWLIRNSTACSEKGLWGCTVLQEHVPAHGGGNKGGVGGGLTTLCVWKGLVASAHSVNSMCVRVCMRVCSLITCACAGYRSQTVWAISRWVSSLTLWTHVCLCVRFRCYVMWDREMKDWLSVCVCVRLRVRSRVYVRVVQAGSLQHL